MNFQCRYRAARAAKDTDEKCSKTEGQSVTQRHDFQISIAQTVYGKHSPNQGSVAVHLKTFTLCLWQAFLPITELLLLSISKTFNSDFFWRYFVGG